MFELLSEPEENSFGSPDIAEAVDVLVVDDFIHYGRTELAKPGKGVVEIIDSEHDAQITQRVHGRRAVIGGDGGGVEARELNAAVIVRGAHHGNFYALAANSGNAAGPFTLDGPIHPRWACGLRG